MRPERSNHCGRPHEIHVDWWLAWEVGLHLTTWKTSCWDGLRNWTRTTTPHKTPYMHLPAYIKLARLKREKTALLTRTDAGGRKCNRIQRSHAEHHRRLVDDFLAHPRFRKMKSCTKLFSFTNYLLKTKTLDALWEKEGAGLDSSWLILVSISVSVSYSVSYSDSVSCLH